jgi:hypothetical protein
MGPMQGMGFDFNTAQAHQPRYQPPMRAHHQDLFTPRYSDPSPYMTPNPGMAGNYPFGAEAMDQWGMVMPGTPRSPTKKNKNQKKADGKQATFLTKLYQWVANNRRGTDFRLLYVQARLCVLLCADSGSEDPQNHRVRPPAAPRADFARLFGGTRAAPS